MMTGILETSLNRRGLLGSLGVGAGALLLGGCMTYEDRVTNVIERLLLLSSERAFARLTAPGGFWDEQFAAIGLDTMLGARGSVLANILTSGLIKARVEREFAGFAIDASERAAPGGLTASSSPVIRSAGAAIRLGSTAWAFASASQVMA